MQHGHLLRVLGVGFVIAGVFGGMVGQGILRSPGIVAEAVHRPGAMIALWLLGAAISLISAFPYAELGTALPCAGGPYDYVRRGIGARWGVLIGWSAFISFATTIGMLAYVTGEFLVRLGAVPTDNPAWPALGVLVLFFAVNFTGTRFSGASQMLFSALKGAALLAFVAAMMAHESAPGSTRAASAAPITALGVAVALRVIIGTYNGWQDIAFFGEEISDPARSLPRSLFGGITLVAIVYLAVVLALLHVLSPAAMAGSNLAAADAAGIVFGARGEMLLTLFGVLSVGAITNLSLMASGRITFALARASILPRIFTGVSDSGSPRLALSVMTVLAAACVISGTYDTLSAASTAFYVFNVIVVTLAAVGLRRREPDLPRPFRMPLFWPAIVVSLVVNAALLVAFVAEQPVATALGFGLLAIAFAISQLLSGRGDAAAPQVS